MMSSFRAVFRKEVLHVRRNKAVAYLALMMPLMQMTMYGFIDQTVHDEPTVVVDQDQSASSRELIDQLRATKTFAIKEITQDPREARTEIIAGRAGVGIVIPPNFHNARARSSPAKVLVLIDGSDNIVASGALAAVNGVVSSHNLQALTKDVRAGMPLSAQPIILFNPEGRTANFIIPGLVADEVLTRRLSIFGCFLGPVMGQPPQRALIAQTMADLAAGRLTMPVSGRFALAEVVEAQRLAETAAGRGRVIMRP